MPPLTSSAINKGKTLAPKAVARRRPAATPKPAQPTPTDDAPASTQDAALPTEDAAAHSPQSDSQQPVQHPAASSQQSPAANTPLPTPPATQQASRHPTPPPPPASRLEPSPLSLTQSVTSSAPPSHQPRLPSPPATQQSTIPEPSVAPSPPVVPEPVRQPSPAAPVALPQQPTSTPAPPTSPTQLAGQKRKRPTPPPTTAPAQNAATVPPAQPVPAQNLAPVAHSETEVALINGLIGHQEHHQAPVAQMLPPSDPPRNDPKPRAKRQRKTAPASLAEGTENPDQAAAGAQEDNAANTTAAKPRKPRAPRAKRAPKSAATVVEDENGNIVETETPTDSARPASKPRKPRQKKQKQPQQAEEENGEAGQDEPIEDPENHEIDITTTTMLDLTRDRGYGRVSERETKMAAIDWDAVHKKRMAEAEAIRAGQDPTTVNKQPTENNEGGEEGEGDDAQETPRPPPIVSGPRLRLDAEGNLVVDEESLRIDRQAQATRNAENLIATENDDLTKRVNQMSWINERRRDPTDRVPFFKMKSDPWSDEETDRFYEALSMFGTDFFIISKMFPPKTRRQIKLKFIREERLEPDRVNRALAGDAVPMKLESFAQATGQDVEGFKDPRELDEELRVEGEEQREEIARKKKEIEEAKKQRDIQMAAREKDQEERAAQRREKAAMRQNRRRGMFGTGTF